MADRIGVLREGRLVQVGTPREIYETPRNVYVAARLGTPAMNLLPGDLLPVEGKPAGTVTVGARTEHLHLARAREGGGAGTVRRVEHLGDQSPVHVEVGEHTLITLDDAALELRAGDRVDVRLDAPPVLRPRWRAAGRLSTMRPGVTVRFRKTGKRRKGCRR